MNFDGLLVTIGAPGAGKSTWADANLSSETLRLERDRFRECLFGSRRGYHESEMPYEERSAFITNLMTHAMGLWPHKSYAVTDTNLRWESIAPFINTAKLWGLEVRLVVFQRSFEFLMTNNRIRPIEHRIPEEIMLEMIEQFNDPEAWWRTMSGMETTYT